MSETKIKIEVEVTPIQMAQIAQIVFGVSLAPGDKPEKPKDKPKAEPKKKEAQKVEEPEPEEQPDEEIVSLDEIRTVMSAKVGNHRDEIKKYLESVNAKNVSTLPESEYNAFHKFLKEL